MAQTVDKLINKRRFYNEDFIQFLIYIPFGLILMVIRIIFGLLLWIASIILPNKVAVRPLLSALACWTFGVYVKVKGNKDAHCNLLVANYISCLDSLVAGHALGTMTLRKWKLPPFFASTLGIKNATQFVKKQHFNECPTKPVLLQPEGVPTNGNGLLKFTEWYSPVGNIVQPVAISAERPFTRPTVHRWEGGGVDGSFPWHDLLWFLVSPCTVFTVRVLAVIERQDDSEGQYSERIRQAIGDALQVELTEVTLEDMSRRPMRRSRPTPRVPSTLEREARSVKEVLPLVPLKDIMKDLARTRSVDYTITNFLEGLVAYVPEVVGRDPQPGPSRAAPRYVTPVPQGVFPRSARERQLSFQERKEKMIAEARQKYIEKHSLNALNC